MKAVLMSIKPKYCELIANGKKTVEVRKTKPKLETPFKVYIYCTASNIHECLMVNKNGAKLIYACNYKTAIPFGGNIANGKVIGEFVCDSIADYEAELWDDETFERIQEFYEPDDFSEYGEYEYKTIATNEDDYWKENKLCRTSCLTVEELRKYLGAGITVFHGLHISDLVIYDKPKDLDCFRKPIDCHRGKDRENCKGCWDCEIKRPPQSWCFVEEMG